MTKKEKQKYQVLEPECYNRDCFLPFSGNGIKICRLYEMGQCPKKYNKPLAPAEIEIKAEKQEGVMIEGRKMEED